MADPSTIGVDLAGPASPPRDNGEIVFAAPWERRVFGLTVAACRSGKCGWESFRQRLISHIAGEPTRPYWQNWLAAFEDVLASTALVKPGLLDARQHEVLKRPAGFDHHD